MSVILVPIIIGGIIIIFGFYKLNKPGAELEGLIGLPIIIAGGLILGTALLIWVGEHITWH